MKVTLNGTRKPIPMRKLGNGLFGIITSGGASYEGRIVMRVINGYLNVDAAFALDGGVFTGSNLDDYSVRELEPGETITIEV